MPEQKSNLLVFMREYRDIKRRLKLALETLTDKKDITPTSDLSQVEPPQMSDFEEVLAGMEGGEDLVLRLKKYTEGTFSGLFNSPTNIDLKNQLIVSQFCP
jgi:type IV secretory pathway VirB4 component